MMSDPLPDDVRVAEVLQQVRSRSGLLELKQREYVREPVAFSHRAGLGKLIVLSRKAFFKLFLKWFVRPVVEQQNAFNQTAARLIEDLVESQERSSRELRRLGARVEALEQRLGKAERSDEGGG
jgi:hypothetical protein